MNLIHDISNKHQEILALLLSEEKIPIKIIKADEIIAGLDSPFL